MNLSFEKVYFQYEQYIELKLKPQSIRTLKERFKKIILPYWKNFDIYEINASHILDFQIFINSKKYSYNYKRNIHFLLSGFFNYCVKFYSIQKNYCSIVGNFKRNCEKKEMNFYTFEEFKKFIKCVDNNIYKQFFNFMFFTGTRPGEAMALKFSDLNDSYISITKTMDQHGKREVNSPKTKSSNRTLIIDDCLKKDLLKLKQTYCLKYDNHNFDYYIFGGIKPLAPTTVNRYKKEACKKANIKEIRLHDFRHSHATLLLNNGIVITEISRRLGHENVTTTLNVYVHNNLENEKRVFETLSNLRNDCPK